MLLGGGGTTEQQVQEVAGKALTVGEKLMAWVSAIWVRLEDGDVMTWVAFVGVLLAVLLVVLAWKGNLARVILALRGKS